MDLLIPILIALVSFLTIYVIAKDVGRFILAKKEKKKIEQSIYESKKRSDLLFEEMKKNKASFESTMFNIKKLSEQLNQQSQNTQNMKEKKDDPQKPDL